MRGCIKGYTRGTEKRLTERLKAFVRKHQDARAVWFTLTTLETDPEISKRLLQRWTKRISRRCRVCGIYVMEFNDRGQVHYHVLMVLGGDVAMKPTEYVADLFWDAWKELGDHDRQAFDFKPANLREPSWVLNYMPKADIAPGDPHPERVQKRSPLAFEGRGLHAAYWGVVGRSVTAETPLNPPFDEWADANSSNREAA